jgi:hypothetical protein
LAGHLLSLPRDDQAGNGDEETDGGGSLSAALKLALPLTGPNEDKRGAADRPLALKIFGERSRRVFGLSTGILVKRRRSWQGPPRLPACQSRNTKKSLSSRRREYVSGVADRTPVAQNPPDLRAAPTTRLANRASRRHDEARAPNTFNRAVVRSNKRVEASASLAQYDAPAVRHDARALICVDPQAAARIDDPGIRRRRRGLR